MRPHMLRMIAAAAAVVVVLAGAITAFVMTRDPPPPPPAPPEKVHIVPPDEVLPPKPKVLSRDDVGPKKPVFVGPMPGKDASDDTKFAWLKLACDRAPCFSDVKSFNARRVRTKAPADVQAFHNALQSCMSACAYR